MESFDYNAAAELFPSRRYAKSSRDHYRRFKTAAEAIRYIIEDVPGTWLIGSLLEVDERRYDAAGIRALYDADNYPLHRLKAVA